MNNRRKRVLQLSGGLISLLSAGCATLGPETAPSRIRLTEDNLLTAGFKIMIADTQDRQRMLHSLPAETISSIPREDHTYYIYPDPELCGCLYVGREIEFAKLEQLAIDRQISNQALMTHELQEDEMSGWGPPAPWNYLANPNSMGRPEWDPD